MNIFGRIMAVSGKRSGIFEDSVTTNATAQELAETKTRKSVYQKAVALTPGRYKVELSSAMSFRETREFRPSVLKFRNTKIPNFRHQH